MNRLCKEISNCANEMSEKVRKFISEIQKEKKIDFEIGLIKDLNRFLSQFKSWNDTNNAKNFKNLEKAIWYINSQIST